MGILSQLIQSDQDIRTILITICFYIPAIMFSLILHEIAHGFVALCCGDDTAKRLGRLSVDPTRHLTLSGTLCLLFLGFGWARPVPVDPRKLNKPRRDMIFVSLAGIIVNFTLFLLSTFLVVLLTRSLLPEFVQNFYGLKEFVCTDRSGFGWLYNGEFESLMIEINNSYPWSIMKPDLTVNTPVLQHFIRFFMLFSIMNLSLAIFNFLPIPPLDGFNFWNLTLLKGKLRVSGRAMQIILIVFYTILLFGDRIFGFSVLDRAIKIIQSAFASSFVNLLG